jgi:hypothetical protein
MQHIVTEKVAVESKSMRWLMTQKLIHMLLGMTLFLMPAFASAGNGRVTFEEGIPLERQGRSVLQNGNLVQKRSLELALSETVPESQPDMSSALRLRRGGRACLFIALPLLIGGVATAIVASSGTVGSREGTMAVYGVSLGLTGTSLVLDIVALALMVKSGRRYDAAIDAYNSRFNGSPTAPDNLQ